MSIVQTDELEEIVDVTVCGLTDVGLVRSNNEDALAVVDLARGQRIDMLGHATILEVGRRGVFLAVSDGMGGENAGEVASALVLDSTTAHLMASTATDPADALCAAVEHANARVLAAAEAPGRGGMGATLVAVLIRDGVVHTAEVGDSRCYLLRRRKLTLVTRDQTQMQLLIESGVLDPETAKTSHARNILLQACGKATELVVAQHRIVLREGDKLLLCSDGLTVHVSDTEIEAVLGSVASLDQACAGLVALAKERGGKDNVTVLAAHVAGPLPDRGLDGDADDGVESVREFAVAESA